jgi:hypothetical protein
MAGVEGPERGWDVEALIAGDGGLLWQVSALPVATEGLADALRDVRAALDALGADPKHRSYAACMAVEALRREQRFQEGRAEVEHGIREYDRAIAFSLWLRVELAEIERSEGRWKEAYAALEEARDLLEPREESPALAHARRIAAADWHGAYGQIDLMLGLCDRAWLDFEREAELAASLGEPANDWAVLDHRFKHALAVGDLARAAGLLDAAGTLPDPSPEDLARLHVRRAIVRGEQEERGEFPSGSAVPELEAAIDLPDLTVLDRLDAAIALAKLLLANGEPSRAKVFVDRARGWLGPASTPGAALDSRSVECDAFDSSIARATGAEPAARRSALETLERSYTAYLSSWRAAPLRPGGIAFQHFGDRYLVASELARAQIDVHGAIDGARRALEWISRTSELGNLARELGHEHRELDELLASILGPRDGLVLLLPGLTRSQVFTVDASGVAVEEIEASWRIVRAREALEIELAAAVRAVRGFGDERLEAAIAELARCTTSSGLLARASRWEGLTLVGEEFFGHLAIECFRMPDGRRLGEAVAVTHAPSLPLAAALAERARFRGPRDAGPRSTRIVAAPAYGPGDLARWDVPPIDIDRERFPADAEVLLGDGATRSAVLEAARNGCDVLEVLAHGIVDPERERTRGLLFAADAGGGALWPEDVEAATAPPLVLLGACGAARQIVRRGDDGRIGLAASFVLRGSDCVVLTTGELEVDSAVEFLGRVRARVFDGDSPAEALRAARADGGPARVQDHMLHAWGWGAEPVFRRGDARRHAPADATARSWWIGIGVLALAAAVGAARFARRRPASRA